MPDCGAVGDIKMNNALNCAFGGAPVLIFGCLPFLICFSNSPLLVIVLMKFQCVARVVDNPRQQHDSEGEGLFA